MTEKCVSLRVKAAEEEMLKTQKAVEQLETLEVNDPDEINRVWECHNKAVKRYCEELEEALKKKPKLKKPAVFKGREVSITFPDFHNMTFSQKDYTLTCAARILRRKDWEKVFIKEDKRGTEGARKLYMEKKAYAKASDAGYHYDWKGVLNFMKNGVKKYGAGKTGRFRIIKDKSRKEEEAEEYLK